MSKKFTGFKPEVMEKTLKALHEDEEESISVKREDLQFLINWFDWEFADKKEQQEFVRIKEEYKL